MVKIIRRKSLGFQPVYDIGVEKEHNFLLANGLVASNCFNKSHSTAYAYVTYQTAYLKANYPVEYMTALLTASSDNQDKVEKYRENSQKMGIEVLPPDINRSQKNFTPHGKKILFGLSAVKNLGEGAIDTIIAAREDGEGDFQSLGDFCSRVDLRLVNRRALETLILCGAFDQLNSNRNQLKHDLDLVITWAQKRAKEKESGQLNLFDLVAQETSKEPEFEQVPSAPPVEDFPLAEKLKLEKEHLGFYVSEHPLKMLQQSTQILAPINLDSLEQQKSRKLLSAVVIVNAIKAITTKQGKQMAFLGIEDVSGQAEAVVFPDTYERIQSYLMVENRLMIWGKVDKRDDKVQLIVEDAEPIEKVNMVMVRMTAQDAMDTTKQRMLKGLLQEQSGEKNKSKVPVVAMIGSGQDYQFVRLGQNYWVQDELATVNSLSRAGFVARVDALIKS